MIPVYNALPYLADAIGSVLSQTLREIEVLVYDDASTDGSGEYLDSLRDPRLRIFHCEKQGYAPLLNRGLHEARAPFIARMDADDVCCPNRLEVQYQILRDHPEVIVCGCQLESIDQKGQRIDLIRFERNNAAIKFHMLFRNHISHPGAMFRAAPIIKVGGYRAEKVPAEDYDLWSRVAPLGRFHNAGDVLLRYRLHEASISAVRLDEQRRHADEVRAEHLQRQGFVNSLEQAQTFHRIHHAIYHDPSYQSNRHDRKFFIGVLERVFDKAQLEDSADAQGIAWIRRQIRWTFTQGAKHHGWFSPSRYQWLKAAIKIDPAAMRFQKLRPLPRRLRHAPASEGGTN